MANLPVSAQTFFNDFKFDVLEYTIKDIDTIIGTYRGLTNSDETGDYIGFLMNDSPNISIGNVISTFDGLESFTVIKITYDRYNGKPELLKAYYSKNCTDLPQSPATTIFNIGTASGSVVGTQSVVNMNYHNSIEQLREQITASNSSDKEQLEKLVSTLEMITNGDIPAQKGIFSKFSEVMERNSWISSSIASAILSWLTAQIH